MPSRPHTPCRMQGCPALVPEPGYCAAHQQYAKEQNRQRERWRGSAASRGYDHRWVKVREQALRRDKYLCVDCLASGRITPAKDVHHVIPFKGLDDPLRLFINNLASVCRSCHNKHTAAQQKL